MGSGLLLWLLTALVCRVAVADNDCKSPPAPPRPAGEEVLSKGVNESERRLVVHLHNALRDRIASGKETRGSPGPQPSAANMNILMWDDELAELAQKWADRREFKHNPCRSTKKYEHAGENLAIQMWTGSKPSDFGWPQAVSNWYDEVADWPKDHVSSYKFNMKTGHYTQLVWAETTRVGCGATTYKNGRESSTLFVCNYAPAGNFMGEPLYEEGAPLSSCAKGRRRRRRRSGRKSSYPSLC